MNVLHYPFARRTALSPPAEFSALHDMGSLARVAMPSGDEAWLATSYIDIAAVMSDHARFSRQMCTSPGTPNYTGVTPQVSTLMTLDPPDHARVRGIVAPSFSPQRTAQLVPQMRELAERLTRDMLSGGGNADLVSDYAVPFATVTMCGMVGIPHAEIASIRQWADAALANADSSIADRERTGWQHLRHYSEPLLADRCRVPQDDLLTSIAAAMSGGRISAYEARQLVATLLITGHETTISRICSSLLFLLLNTRQRLSAFAHPGRVATAVDELLRLVPAGDGSFMSIARESVELPGGTVSAGEAVLTPVTAANHDPQRFDCPGDFRPGRARRHCSFGFGIHRCLGASLATAQLRVALSTFARLAPHAELSVPDDQLHENTEISVRPLESLPVTFG